MSVATETILLRPVRSIGGLKMDVTIAETHTDDLDFTDHPVDKSANITDHIIGLPASLTIRAGVSDSGGSSTGDKRSVEAYNALRELQTSGEPFDVITGKRAYKNMLIKSLSHTTDEDTENSLLFTAELREVLLVSAQIVSVPRSRQRSGHVTGDVDQRGQQQLEPKEVKKASGIFTLIKG